VLPSWSAVFARSDTNPDAGFWMTANQVPFTA
jgi:hypothetical protein